jgi:hypothetical protein
MFAHLIKAVKEGRDDLVEDFLKEPGSVSLINRTLPKECCPGGRAKKDGFDSRLMHLAVCLQGDFDGDHLSIVGTLLRNRADVNAANRQGFTPLHDAAQNSKVECAKRLLQDPRLDIEAQTFVDDNDDSCFTPLILAVKDGDSMDMVRLLLAHGANVNAKDKQNFTALHWCCPEPLYPAKPHCAQVLLERHASVDERDNFGATPLWYTVNHAVDVPETSTGTVTLIQLLLEQGADVCRYSNNHSLSLLAVTPMFQLALTCVYVGLLLWCPGSMKQNKNTFEGHRYSRTTMVSYRLIKHNCLVEKFGTV